MKKLVSGIHHVTAMAGNPQKNVDFYAGILGVRFVKKTVNFDAPDVYHFYYGDEVGLPGSIMTFFPFGDDIRGGRHGKGMLNTTSFSVPRTALPYWEKRLKQFDIDYTTIDSRFGGETAFYFKDHDGLGLELVFSDRDQRPGFTYGHIPIEHSIRGFYGVEIWEHALDATASLLTERLDHVLIGQEGNRFRFAADDKPGNFVDLVIDPQAARGQQGNGTVHHIAFATEDQSSQEELRAKLEGAASPTPIIDRQYFTSIYFREPGGVLFEVATNGPGFPVDEDVAHLGEELKLPPQYEEHRNAIEQAVTPIVFKPSEYK